MSRREYEEGQKALTGETRSPLPVQIGRRVKVSPLPDIISRRAIDELNLDVDNSILDLKNNPELEAAILNGPLLIPLLQFFSKIGGIVNLVTSRTGGLDTDFDNSGGTKVVQIAYYLKEILGVRIGAVVMYRHANERLQQLEKNESKENMAAQDIEERNELRAGKNFYLQVAEEQNSQLYQEHLQKETLPPARRALYDDEPKNPAAAVNMGYKVVIVPPADQGIEYLQGILPPILDSYPQKKIIEEHPELYQGGLEQWAGIQEYLKSLESNPECHSGDKREIKEAAQQYQSAKRFYNHKPMYVLDALFKVLADAFFSTEKAIKKLQEFQDYQLQEFDYQSKKFRDPQKDSLHENERNLLTSTLLNRQDEDGETLSSLAIKRAHLDSRKVIVFLVEQGAKCNQLVGKEQEPLIMRALEKKRFGVVAYLASRLRKDDLEAIKQSEFVTRIRSNITKADPEHVLALTLLFPNEFTDSEAKKVRDIVYDDLFKNFRKPPETKAVVTKPKLPQPKPEAKSPSNFGRRSVNSDIISQELPQIEEEITRQVEFIKQVKLSQNNRQNLNVLLSEIVKQLNTLTQSGKETKLWKNKENEVLFKEQYQKFLCYYSALTIGYYEITDIDDKEWQYILENIKQIIDNMDQAYARENKTVSIAKGAMPLGIIKGVFAVYYEPFDGEKKKKEQEIREQEKQEKIKKEQEFEQQVKELARQRQQQKEVGPEKLLLDPEDFSRQRRKRVERYSLPVVSTPISEDSAPVDRQEQRDTKNIPVLQKKERANTSAPPPSLWATASYRNTPEKKSFLDRRPTNQSTNQQSITNLSQSLPQTVMPPPQKQQNNEEEQKADTKPKVRFAPINEQE